MPVSAMYSPHAPHSHAYTHMRTWAITGTTRRSPRPRACFIVAAVTSVVTTSKIYFSCVYTKLKPLKFTSNFKSKTPIISTIITLTSTYSRKVLFYYYCQTEKKTFNLRQARMAAIRPRKNAARHLKEAICNKEELLRCECALENYYLADQQWHTEDFREGFRLPSARQYQAR